MRNDSTDAIAAIKIDDYACVPGHFRRHSIRGLMKKAMVSSTSTSDDINSC
jgi:hypothetical protein